MAARRRRARRDRCARSGTRRPWGRRRRRHPWPESAASPRVEESILAAAAEGYRDLPARVRMRCVVAHGAQRWRNVLHGIGAMILARKRDWDQQVGFGVLLGRATRRLTVGVQRSAGPRDGEDGRAATAAVLRCVESLATESVRDEVMVLVPAGAAGPLGPLRAHGVLDDLGGQDVAGLGLLWIAPHVPRLFAVMAVTTSRGFRRGARSRRRLSRSKSTAAAACHAPANPTTKTRRRRWGTP